MTKFGKFLEKSIKKFIGEALQASLDDTNATLIKNDIEAAWFSNSGWGMRDNQHCIRGPLNGKISVNPSGGLLSCGHPIDAFGLAQIYELVTQLRGEAGKRQFKESKFALAENGGGNIGPGEAAMCIHILEKI